jgi:hypothetical protein
MIGGVVLVAMVRTSAQYTVHSIQYTVHRGHGVTEYMYIYLYIHIYKYLFYICLSMYIDT